VNVAAFSADGRSIFTGSDDKVGILWDRETGKRIATFDGHRSAVGWGELSPDGALLVTAAQDGMRVWDAATGRLLQQFTHFSGVSDVAFSNDGRKLVAVEDDGVAEIWQIGLEGEQSLKHFLSCRLPLRLEGEQIVAVSPRCD
jgi:WD40 repeat protein